MDPRPTPCSTQTLAFGHGHHGPSAYSVLEPAPFTQSIPEPAPATQSIQEPELIDLLGLSPTHKALPPLLAPPSSIDSPVLSIFINFMTLPFPLPCIIVLMVLSWATGHPSLTLPRSSFSSGSSQLAPPVQSQSPDPPQSLERWNLKRTNPQAQTPPITRLFHGQQFLNLHCGFPFLWLFQVSGEGDTVMSSLISVEDLHFIPVLLL